MFFFFFCILTISRLYAFFFFVTVILLSFKPSLKISVFPFLCLTLLVYFTIAKHFETHFAWKTVLRKGQLTLCCLHREHEGGRAIKEQLNYFGAVVLPAATTSAWGPDAATSLGERGLILLTTPLVQLYPKSLSSSQQMNKPQKVAGHQWCSTG